LKLHKAVPLDQASKSEPGTITAVGDDGIVVACGEGSLKLTEVQPESRTRMKVQDFLKGHDLKVGDRLGI
jgi:methionyl-tRNA formyltransferase